MTQKPPLTVSTSLDSMEHGQAEILRHPVSSTALEWPRVSGTQLNPSLGTSRKGPKTVVTFYPSKLKTLGIIFLLRFQVNKVLGLVKNYKSDVSKYLGMTSPLSSSPSSYEFSSCCWLILGVLLGKKQKTGKMERERNG